MANRVIIDSLTAGAVTGDNYMDNVRGHLKVLLDKITLPVTSPAGTNSYTGTVDPSFDGDGLVAGMKFMIVWPNSNTGAATLAINGLSSVGIVDRAGNALVAGKLVANTLDELYYDGTNFRLISVPETDITDDQIGWSQTVQDVIASRAASTVYTNDTGKPIFIAIEFTASAGQTFEISTDGGTVYEVVMRSRSASAQFQSVLVPPGGKYRLLGTFADVSAWLEIR